MNKPPAQGISAVLPSIPTSFMPLSEIRTNVISGIVVGIVALPLAIGVGAPPVAGLYTSAFAGGFAALFGGSRYRFRDKVMQIRNNYDKNVFNGDIGRVTSINREGREIKVNYDGREVAYDFNELDEVVPAYAISIHKSQGSEYPAVVIPLLTQHFILLQRNLVYTAITRGRRLVVLVGTKKALAIAVKNDKPRKRYTRLAMRLAGAMEKRDGSCSIY